MQSHKFLIFLLAIVTFSRDTQSMNNNSPDISSTPTHSSATSPAQQLANTQTTEDMYHYSSGPLEEEDEQVIALPKSQAEAEVAAKDAMERAQIIKALREELVRQGVFEEESPDESFSVKEGATHIDLSISGTPYKLIPLKTKNAETATESAKRRWKHHRYIQSSLQQKADFLARSAEHLERQRVKKLHEGDCAAKKFAVYQQEQQAITANILKHAPNITAGAPLDHAIVKARSQKNCLKELQTNEQNLKEEISGIQQRLRRNASNTYEFANERIQLIETNRRLFDIQQTIARTRGELTGYEARVGTYKMSVVKNELSNVNDLNLAQLQSKYKKLTSHYNATRQEQRKLRDEQQELRATIREAHEKLGSLLWKLNPWGESRASIEDRLQKASDQEKATYIAYEKARQQGQAIKIADEQVRQMITHRKRLFNWIDKSTSDSNHSAPSAYNEQLAAAIKNTQQDGGTIHNAQYKLDSTITLLLAKHGIDVTSITQYAGNHVQLHMHSKFIETLNTIDTVYTRSAQVHDLLDIAVATNITGQRLNNECHIEQALAAQEACNAVIQYATTIADFCLAGAEGTLNGALSTASSVLHPITTASNIVHGLSHAVLSYGKLIAGSLEMLELMRTNPMAAIAKQKENGAKFDALLNELRLRYRGTATRDKVKLAAQIITECILPAKLLSGAHKVASMTSKATKVAFALGSTGSEAESLLASAQKIIAHPEAVLVEEVTAFVTETAHKDASVVKAVCEFAQHDAAFLEKAGAQQNIGKVLSEAFELNKPGDQLVEFSAKTIKHMDDPNRFVPAQIINYVVKNTPSYPDPKGSRAMMHYSKMWKNGSEYNFEALYDKETNRIWHFLYTEKARGPLPQIGK